jgi:GAF domain-containing protein
MGRGPAKGNSPKKPSGKKASAVRRSAQKRVAKAVRRSSGASPEAEAARLARKLDEAQARQAATSEILRIISQSTGNVQPVFDAIVLAAIRLLGCDRAHFLRCDATTFFPVAVAGPEGLLEATATAPVPIDPDTNLPSRAIVARKDTYLPDWSKIDLPAFERSTRNLRGTNSSLLLPMLREGECIGVLALASKRANNFDDSDIALAKSFRDKALIAIENARLFNETREALERQTATAEILKVIASSPSDVQPVFEAIASSANRLLGGHSTGVMRAIDGVLHLAAFTPINPAADAVLKSMYPMPVGAMPFFELLARGEPYQVPDMEAIPVEPPKQLARARGYRSLLWVPLMNAGQAIGIISVSRAATGRFALHEVQLLQTFADQAVIAIENTRLFNETQEALERQTATADVLNVIGRSPTDAAPVFDVIGERAEKLCNAEISVVSVLDGDLIKLAGIRGISREGVELFRSHFPMRPDRQTVTARTIKSGTIVHIGDVLADPAYDNKGLAAQTGYRSCLGVPMHNKGQVVGAIFVARTEPGLFSNNQIQLLQIFADQAVIAIQNTRLFNETREALERQTATADILKVIASSPDDVQPVFEAIAERSNRIANGRATAVYSLVDGILHLMAFTPTSPEADARLRAFFPRRLSQMRWGEAIGRGEKYEIEDMEDPSIPQDGRDLSRLRGYRGLLLVPLVQDRQTIGAISVTRAEPGRFADHHVELLKTFADQAVIAISNVELFNEVQKRTQELSQSLDDLRAAQDRLVQTEKLASLGQLTAGIAHEIKNPLNFVNNFSALSAELTDELNDMLKAAELTGKMREEVGELTRLLKENLEKVVQHGKRADSIVKNMLLHSRAGSGEQRNADVNALVDESLSLAYHGARAEKSGFNITLQRDFDAAAGTAELFPQEITRALLNLISNGFYAATKRLTENGEAGFEPTLLATTKSLGNSVEIRIRDNGAGIPPEVKEKMFNPFFTTKPAGEGTGLGLSMTHDIVVKQHGGRIDVATEPGQFTEFVIVLPRAGNLHKAG